MEAPEFLAPKEIARLAGVDVSTVHQACRFGRLPAVKLGKRYLIRVAD